MPFDPFGDFETRGYLRNLRAYKTAAAVKRFEHREYYRTLQLARDHLTGVATIGYDALLATHRTLFATVYPWAGHDRAVLGVANAVVRGRLHFATAEHIRRVASQALTLANDAAIMAKQPGLLISELAFAHPFLEGNGRTLLVVQTELARRAGISIDWRDIPLRTYLVELTKEIVLPGSGYLDGFLKPYVQANPDRIIVERHQPAFDTAAPVTRPLAYPDPVLRGPRPDGAARWR